MDDFLRELSRHPQAVPTISDPQEALKSLETLEALHHRAHGSYLPPPGQVIIVPNGPDWILVTALLSGGARLQIVSKQLCAQLHDVERLLPHLAPDSIYRPAV